MQSEHHLLQRGQQAKLQETGKLACDSTYISQPLRKALKKENIQ